MRQGQSLSLLTARLLTGLEEIFNNHRPDLVLGHGDTTTCFASALSSFYHQIPFFHVEAGLRTHLLETPFPEEFNRQSVAPLAHHHFAPTEVERENLLREGIKSQSITVTGATTPEAIELIRKKTQNTENVIPLNLSKDKKIVTVTLHRREGLNSLEQKLEGIRLVAQTRKDVIFICPIHPNPLVQTAFKKSLAEIDNILLAPPLSYSAFISLLLQGQLILTDSGGVQEEGNFLGKRVLLARTETERADGIQEGLVSLIGTSTENIVTHLNENLDQIGLTTVPKRPIENATDIIAEQIERAAI